jgi:hypothetical protein
LASTASSPRPSGGADRFTSWHGSMRRMPRCLHHAPDAGAPETSRTPAALGFDWFFERCSFARASAYCALFPSRFVPVVATSKTPAFLRLSGLIGNFHAPGVDDGHAALLFRGTRSVFRRASRGFSKNPAALGFNRYFRTTSRDSRTAQGKAQSENGANPLIMTFFSEKGA